MDQCDPLKIKRNSVGFTTEKYSRSVYFIEVIRQGIQYREN